MKSVIKKTLWKIFDFISFPFRFFLKRALLQIEQERYQVLQKNFSSKVRVYPPFQIGESEVGDYTYVAINSMISLTKIGKFCSIGPNFLCGYGIHPLDGLSTSPMFYSTKNQNGVSLSKADKIIERSPVTIGHDVFIGANVTVLDGVKIGNGAVIGAGAVVVKDIPAYAIAVGVPAKVINYRFKADVIAELEKIEWWNFPEEKLPLVEKYFSDVEEFISLINRTK